MTRVVRFHGIGGPEVLKVEDVAVPAPKAGEVQIRVKAMGLNRAEVMFRTNQYVTEPVFPAIIGYEAAGTVDVGDEVLVLPAGTRSRVPGHQARAGENRGRPRRRRPGAPGRREGG